MSNETKDIILDDQAFEEAKNGLLQLAKDIKSLYNDLNEALKTLQTGFDTEAGRKYVSACRKDILTQMAAQFTVVREITVTLNNAKNKYSGVFTEYENLNNKLGQYKKGG